MRTPALEALDPSRRTIPFDYSFRFQRERDPSRDRSLKGIPGRVVSATVTVSVEADFTAISIGYGVIPAVTPVRFGPTLPAPAVGRGTTRLGDIRIADLVSTLRRQLLSPDAGTGDVLAQGFRLNPDTAALVLQGAGLDGAKNALPLPQSVLPTLFEAVAAPPEEVQFLYALHDQGTGREFQSDPILSTAGLGSASGERPFRYFAQPITFAARSAIRVDVTEVGRFRGDLHITLHGYKTLGGAGTPTAPEPRPASRPRARHR